MHPGEPATEFGAVRGGRREFAAAAQPLHHRGRLAGHGIQQFAWRVGRRDQRQRRRFRHCRVGDRCRDRNALGCQVLHQAKVVGELAGAQAFEEREYEFATLGGREVVGVLDAALDALQRRKGPQAQSSKECVRFVETDVGIDRHAGQNFIRFQTRGPLPPLPVSV